jgi:hypothetical protein
MPTIEITVDPEGKVTVEGVGFKGKSCDKAMEAYEKALGTSGKKKLKPEYYQREIVRQTT